MTESAGGAGALDAAAETQNHVSPEQAAARAVAEREAAQAADELAGMTEKLAQAERDHEAATGYLAAAEARNEAAQAALSTLKG